MKVAIVEDDEGYAKMFHLLMDQWDVTWFPEVSNFKDDGFNVVFSDLGLHDTWGLDTIRKLRPMTNAPIIVLSGLGGSYIGTMDRVQILAAGANDMFAKEMIRDPSFPHLVEKIVKEKDMVVHKRRADD